MTNRVTIVGARPYRVRVGHNVTEWKETVAEMHYDEKDGVVAAEIPRLRERGVRPSFLSYLIRNDFLKVVD